MKAALLIFSALFSTLFSSHTFAADRLSLLLDWFVNPNHAPIIIAQEKGYFARQGLEVEVIAPADPADPPKLVAAGKADLAVAYQPQLHLQVHGGLPLVRVGTLIATPLNCLLVLADGPIQSIADLRGRKVGFSVAGVDEALITALLKPHSLTLDDVEMVNVNWSMSPALMARQVDAVIGAYRNFELHQMAAEDVPGRCFFLEEEGLPAYDELIYVASSKRRDDAKLARFFVAVEQAAQFIVNNPTTAWEVFAATAKELQNDLNRRAWSDTVPRIALRPAAFDAGRYARMEHFLQRAGLVEEVFAVDRLAVDVTR